MYQNKILMKRIFLLSFQNILIQMLSLVRRFSFCHGASYLRLSARTFCAGSEMSEEKVSNDEVKPKLRPNETPALIDRWLSHCPTRPKKPSQQNRLLTLNVALVSYCNVRFTGFHLPICKTLVGGR